MYGNPLWKAHLGVAELRDFSLAIEGVRKRVNFGIIQLVNIFTDHLSKCRHKDRAEEYCYVV